MMRLFIVRHGATAYNVGEKRIRGRIELPLSELGLKQADLAGKALAKIPLDVIYYSKIKRAAQTAEKIKKYNEKAQLIEEPLLIDLSFGDWEGKTLSEIFKSKEEEQRYYEKPSDFLIPNGETFYQGLDRIHRLFLRLRTQTEQNIALVTHGAMINLIFVYLYKTHVDMFWKFLVEPASISEVELLPDGAFRIIRVNDCNHLKNLQSNE